MWLNFIGQKPIRSTVIRVFAVLLILCIYDLASANKLCVTKDGATLKAAPKAGSATSWKVPKYMPLYATGKNSGEFLEVTDVDGERHWVNRLDVSTKLNCLVVKAALTTLRTGPGNDYPRTPAGYADRYSAFLDLGGEDGWTMIADNEGGKSWINLDTIWKPARILRMNFEN